MVVYHSMMKKQSLFLSIICLSVISIDRVKPENFLPSIWDSIMLHKSYHVTYQIRMPGSNEVIALEEYASFNRQLFRLDLVSGESRVTYLTNGKTGEIFSYKPFTCETLNAKAKDLGVIANLFKGYTIGEGGRVPVYGIGPLWLRAKESASSMSMIDQSSGNKLDKHVGYLVKFDDSDDEVRYDLAFYFRNTKSFVSIIEWIDKTPEQTVEASAKLTALFFDELPDSDLEIPVGYGCVRVPNTDSPISPDIKVRLFVDGYPSYVSLEILTSMPVDEAMTEWDNHATSVSIIRSSGNQQQSDHDYYVSHTRERDIGEAKLKKVKKVWTAPALNANQALVYTIDEQTGTCQVKHVEAGGHMALMFPKRPGLKQMAMSLDLIKQLFEDNSDFHFIREEFGEPLTSVSSGRFRTGYYEKRLDKFEVTANNQKIWTGPVSIVKKITSFVLPFDMLLLSHVRVFVSVYFYNSDYSRIEYKAVFKLTERGVADVVHLLKDMDVGECYSEKQKTGLIIKYPLSSNHLSNRLESMAYMIEDDFFTDLFRTTAVQPMQISRPAISFNTFNMYIKLTLLDVPLWHTHDMRPNTRLSTGENKSAFVDMFSSSIETCSRSCDHYHCFRFSYEESTFKCRLELVKDALDTETSKGAQLYSYTENKSDQINSPWTKYSEYGGRSQLRPQSVLDLFRGMISDEPDKDSDEGLTSPLVIRVPRELIFDLPDQNDLETDYLAVRPISIESDMESLNEFIKSENGIHLRGNLNVEYTVFMDETRFSSTSAVEQLTVTNYDDCAQSCEDADCRSFSYCKNDQTCRITRKHKQQEIAKTTNPRAGCTVFVLDYLSKFEDLGPVTTPLLAKSIIGDVTERDCANLCMEADFNCQGFHYCEPPQKKPSCLMQDKHVSNTTDFKNLKPKENSIPCRLFSRSYLGQFDQYHGKKLEFPEDKQVANSVRLVRGLGAEACAQSCIEESCVAFDICLDSQAGYSDKLLCQLALQEVRESHMVRHQFCNTFLLSDKSQFKRLIDKMTLDGQDSPDQEALDKQSNVDQIVVDSEQNEADNDINMDVFKLLMESKYTDIVKGSHWFVRLIMMLVGSVLGAFCVVVWRNKEDLLERGLQTVSKSRI